LELIALEDFPITVVYPETEDSNDLVEVGWE
jgi:hypothetical protein